MTGTDGHSAREVDEVRALARPLVTDRDLDALVARVRDARFVCLGEASHGTHEFYRWRAELSRLLVERHGFSWIGVEADWPDCWRLNRWARGLGDPDLDARGVLAGFRRWPTWMWANTDVADFLDWLRELNLTRPPELRVGFYGLDVYSLWDSLRRTIDWLTTHAPDALPEAMRAWRCFLPYREEPHSYAWDARLVPRSCESDVVSMLVQVRRRARAVEDDEEAAFDAEQNAEVAAGAERYYRSMVVGDQRSWNVRDHHMADTVDRLAARAGPDGKGLVWAHNSHVGDARATDMTAHGLVNLGQLLRERHGERDVALVGFGCHRGTVLAASAWGTPERVLHVPHGREPTHEGLLHRALGRPAVLVFGPDRSGPWLSSMRGQRAIGVVYDPERTSGSYVLTRMGARYDALVWFEETTALRALHHEGRPVEPELETEPSGF
jgi:erythromycin esterase-like protein